MKTLTEIDLIIDGKSNSLLTKTRATPPTKKPMWNVYLLKILRLPSNRQPELLNGRS